MTRRNNANNNGSDSEATGSDELSSKQYKKLLSVFEGKLSTAVKEFKKQLAERDSIIDTLKSEVNVLKIKVMSLDNKKDDGEVNERRSTVIVSGSALPSAVEGEDCAEIVAGLVKEKINLVISPSAISGAHRLGKKTVNQTADNRSIIMKLGRSELKGDLIKACKRVKPPNLFINENLTRVRSTALFGLRQARKKFPDKIAGCGSYDGSVFLLAKPPNPSAPNAKNSKVIVNTREKFCDICSNFLKCDPSDLVSNWPV